MRPSSHESARVTVRPATLADAAALATLTGQLGYPSTLEQIAQRLAQISTLPDHAVFVAEVVQSHGAAGVAGWVHGSVRRILENDPFVEIGGLIVDENQRGLGIGALLMDQLERWARGMGCGAVTVRSNVVRGRAHAFYQRRGYATVKTQHVFRKPLTE